jgi:hypothetical protein
VPGGVTLAFVGQATYFDYCALEDEARGVTPQFLDYRAGDDPGPLAARLRELAPDVVLAFRPETLPAGVLRETGATTVGFLTEPLPRPGEPSHPDLDQRLEYLAQLDAGQFDRIVSFDPVVVPTIERFAPVWRCMPIPVADRYYADPAPPRASREALFTGRSTPHRESFLAPVKHHFELVHLAHGVTGERLIGFVRDADVGVNLHNEPYPTFENRVCVYLAAGLLVISEPLSPQNGLRPGHDHLEVRTPAQLFEAVRAFNEDAEAFRPIRAAGRRQAERFRASHVYPALVRDLRQSN